ncbi:MAG: hypothetical protein AAF984_02115 [Verrucomicrobiota bacterium]
MLKDYLADIDTGAKTKSLHLETGDVLNCQIFDRNRAFTNVKMNEGWIYRLLNEYYEIVETETLEGALEGTTYLSEYGVYVEKGR